MKPHEMLSMHCAEDPRRWSAKPPAPPPGADAATRWQARIARHLDTEDERALLAQTADDGL